MLILRAVQLGALWKYTSRLEGIYLPPIYQVLQDHCVWSNQVHKTLLYVWVCTVYPTTIMYYHHQLFFDIERYNIGHHSVNGRIAYWTTFGHWVTRCVQKRNAYCISLNFVKESFPVLHFILFKFWIQKIYFFKAIVFSFNIQIRCPSFILSTWNIPIPSLNTNIIFVSKTFPIFFWGRKNIIAPLFYVRRCVWASPKFFKALSRLRSGRPHLSLSLPPSNIHVTEGFDFGRVTLTDKELLY